MLVLSHEPGFENVEDRSVGVLDLSNIVVISVFRRSYIQSRKSDYSQTVSKIIENRPKS